MLAIERPPGDHFASCARRVDGVTADGGLNGDCPPPFAVEVARRVSRSGYPPPMASAELSRRVERVVSYPPLVELSEHPSVASTTRRCSRPPASRICRGSGRRRS